MEGSLIVLAIMVLLAAVAGPILAIVALVMISSLRREVAQLRRSAPTALPPQETPPVPARPPATPAAPRPVKSALADLAAPSFASRSAAPLQGDRPSPTTAASRMQLEQFLGKKLLAWVGIVVLLIASGWFLQYVFSQHLLPPIGKVLVQVALGLALLIAGEWTNHRKWIALARALSGGGIAALLFASFASTAMYDPPVVQWQAAFVFMMIIVAVSILLAVRYDSLTIAIISTLGGVAVPLMLWNRIYDFYHVFGFLAAVNIGVMILAYFKHWRVINLIALLGTVLIVLFWLGERHGFVLQQAIGDGQTYGVPPGMALAVVGTFFGLFLLVGVVYHLGRGEERPLDLPNFLINPVWSYATIYNLFNKDYHNWMAPLAVGLGAIYLVLAMLIKARGRDISNVILLSAAVALGFLTIAIPIQLNGIMIPMAFALEALALCAVAAFGRISRLGLAGFMVYLCMGASLLHYLDQLTQTYEQTILNVRFLTLAVCLASLAATAVLVRRKKVEFLPECGAANAVVPALAAHVLALFIFTVETNTLFSHHAELAHSHFAQQMVYSLGYGLYAAALLVAGFALRQAYLRIAGLALFAVTVGKVLTYDMAELKYLYRIFSFFGLAVLLLAGAWLYHRYSSRLLPAARTEETTNA